MKAWQLPDYISDLLPPKAAQMETIKNKILNLFKTHGFLLVSPPLLEFSNSLLVNYDSGLAKKTIQITDQISGEQLGIRSDITTQITRIDAHLSTSNAVNRFCYAGLTLHALPQSLIATREPLQVGAEIFGHQGVEADIEVIELMSECIQVFPIPKLMLSLGHIDIFNSLIEEASIPPTKTLDLIKRLTVKDSQAVKEYLDSFNIPFQLKQSFVQLTSLYGYRDVINRAKNELIQTPRIQKAILELEKIISFFKNHSIYIDLSELRTDRYHTGLLYGIYADGWPNFLAKGGRYDNLGRFFGNARPATGFSLDLKDFLSVIPEEKINNAIKVQVKDYEPAKIIIEALRQQGEIVVIEYEPKEIIEGILCNRQLKQVNNKWVITSCN